MAVYSWENFVCGPHIPVVIIFVCELWACLACFGASPSAILSEKQKYTHTRTRYTRRRHRHHHRLPSFHTSSLNYIIITGTRGKLTKAKCKTVYTQHVYSRVVMDVGWSICSCFP